MGSYGTKEEIPRRKLQNHGKTHKALNVTTATAAVKPGVESEKQEPSYRQKVAEDYW